MVTTLLFDLSRVLLFAKDADYKGELNALNKKLLGENPNYDFSSHFYLNQEILDYLGSLENKYEMYMFTSGSIQNNIAIKPTLDKIFKSIISAEQIGFSKSKTGAYVEVLKKLNKRPSEVLFIDDYETNIKAAGEAGLNTLLFVDNKGLSDKLASL